VQGLGARDCALPLGVGLQSGFDVLFRPSESLLDSEAVYQGSSEMAMRHWNARFPVRAPCPHVERVGQGVKVYSWSRHLKSQCEEHMQNSFGSRAILIGVVSGAFVLTVACGGGTSNVSYPTASVASTANPLVASVSVNAPCAGQAVVEFGPDTAYGRSTASYPIPGQLKPISILVAGMKPSTTYHMRAQVSCSAGSGNSQDLTFTTGALPKATPATEPSLGFPTISVTRPNSFLASSENPGIEMVTITQPGEPAFFTDRDGNVIWYYDTGQGNYPFPFKMLPNGHILVNITASIAGNSGILREIDLAGNTIRQMGSGTLAQKVQAAGFDFIPIGIHHDILPLDNGHVLVLVLIKKNFDNLPGFPGTTQVMGDGIIDLDQDWNPVWAWNAFDHLDVNRHLLSLPDWTHGNALVYSPSDGNILFSMRHQSWIIKIDYSNGAGTGRVLWRLGYQGDFVLAQGNDPSLWFSFQHFPSLISQSGFQTTLAVWDNGDFRVLDSTGATCGRPPSFTACYSRATVFKIDEGAMVASLSWADPLAYFGFWGGSVNQLQNGNVEFDLNAATNPTPDGDDASQVLEVSQTSSPQVVWEMDIQPTTRNAYRAYRVPSLYPGVTWTQ
jgi:arylsulfate sulfotransferase